MKMYSFKDSFNGFGPILLYQYDSQAFRAFVMYLNENDVRLADMYSLYSIGYFDIADGVIDPEIHLIITGKDIVPELLKMKEDETYFPDIEKFDLYEVYK